MTEGKIFCESKLQVTYSVHTDYVRKKENPNGSGNVMRITEENESNVDERICPICGESCEKEYETVFVHGQETCVCCNSNIDIYQLRSVCCNSNIEPCYEEGNDKVFVDLFDELGFLSSP